MQSTATGRLPAAPAAPVSVAAPARAGPPQSVSPLGHDVIPVARREGRGPEPALSLSKGPALSLLNGPTGKAGPATPGPGSPRPGSVSGASPGSSSGIVGEGFKPSPTPRPQPRIAVRDNPGSPLPGLPAGTGHDSPSGGGHGSPSGIVGEGLKPSPTARRHLRIGVRGRSRFSVRGISKAGSGPRISARLLSRRHCRGGFETLPYARWRRPQWTGTRA